MKIVNFQEFALMPEGTIFSYFQPMICEGLYRKGQTLFRGGVEWSDPGPCDFYETSLVACCWNGQPPTVGESSRWGMYEYDQQFCVYEEADIQVLVDLLRGPAAPPEEKRRVLVQVESFQQVPERRRVIFSGGPADGKEMMASTITRYIGVPMPLGGIFSYEIFSDEDGGPAIARPRSRDSDELQHP